MTPRHASWLFAFSLALPACHHSSDELNLYFRDDLVEAPARTVDVVAVSGTDCKTLLAKRHDDAAMGVSGTVLARRNTRYPVNPDAKVLDNLPRGMPIALDIATYDHDSLEMARACQVVTLEPGGMTKVDVEMLALSICPDVPVTTLDVAIVMDISNTIGAADPSNVHLVEFEQHIIDATTHFSQPASWTLITDDDPDGAKEVLPQTTDVEMLKTALNNLVMTHDGNPRAYDGVTLAAKKLRARSVCGVRPALLVFLGGFEMNPAVGEKEEAQVEIVATRGDMTDDIFTFGLALTNDAYDELNDLIPMEVGSVEGAEGEYQIQMKMNDVGMAIKGLVQ